MHMTFHFGYHEVVLFDKWHIQNWVHLTYSVIGIIALAFVYEGLKGYRNYLYVKTARALKGQGKKSRWSLMFSGAHSVQTILHALQLYIGYILMLIFMTYNVWLCFAVIIGATLGYWLFSPDKISNDNTDCCF